MEDALEMALTQILQHPVQIEAASRLDRGVHARGQVISFETPRLVTDLDHRVNCLLPPTIRILKQTLQDETFHPSLSVKKKEYRYLIDNNPIQSPFQRNYAWHLKEPLNVEAMRKAAIQLVGTHDFEVFCNRRKGLNYKNYVRTIHEIAIESTPSVSQTLDFRPSQSPGVGRSELDRTSNTSEALIAPPLSAFVSAENQSLRHVGYHNSFIEIKIVGNRFLYKMCRNIVGLLVSYGKGAPMQPVQEILSKKQKLFATAPAQGLCLHQIDY